MLCKCSCSQGPVASSPFPVENMDGITSLGCSADGEAGMVGTSNNSDVLHYPVLTALRTNSLSLECPSLHEEGISLSCQVSFHSHSNPWTWPAQSLGQGVCETLLPWDKCRDTCVHLGTTWQNVGRAGGQQLELHLQGAPTSRAHQTQTADICRDKLANVFVWGLCGCCRERELLSLAGDEVALAGAEPAWRCPVALAHERCPLPSRLGTARAGGHVTQWPRGRCHRRGWLHAR